MSPASPSPASLPPAADHRALRARMAPELPEGLVAHIDRVVTLAQTLARRHGADEGRAMLAAQGHDLVRHWGDARWLAEAATRGLEVLPAERAEPVLLHGPLGAALLEERGWLADAALLDAIRYHTTGHPAYTPEAWAMFVADKIEPHKVARRPDLAVVVAAAERSLEAAALAYLELMEEQGRQTGWAVHPLQAETLTFLRAVAH